MIVYIAGKMRGLPDLGRRKFFAAQRYIEESGNIVLNPAWLPTTMPNNKYMPICLSMLEQADAIYLLDNWRDSQGACIEREYAVLQGKIILEEEACENKEVLIHEA